ncbi:MAG: PDZ domain-containing protein [Phycisphaerales bacterium]
MNRIAVSLPLVLCAAALAQPAASQPSEPASQPAATKPAQPTREALDAAWQEAYAKKDYDGAVKGLEALARFAPGDPIVRYNLACVHAQRGDIDSAERALKKCLELGFTDFPRLLNEKDLQPLNETAVYMALREGWRELQDTSVDHRLSQFRRTLSIRNAKGEVTQSAEARGYQFEKDAKLRLAYVSGFSKDGHAESRHEIKLITDYWGLCVLPEGVEAVVSEGAKPDPWVLVFLPNNADWASWATANLGPKSDRIGGIYDNWKLQLIARDLGSTMRHEYWHSLHWRHMSRIGQVHPVWIQEGLCSLIEDVDLIPEGQGKDGRERVVPVASWRTNTAKRMMKTNLLPKLSVLMTMDEKTYMGSRALGNYAASRAFFLWLSSRMAPQPPAPGQPGFAPNPDHTLLKDWYAAYIADYPTDPSGKTTTERVLGKPIAELDKEFRAWLTALPDVGEPNTPGLPTLPCDMQPTGGEGMVVIGTATKDLLKNPLLAGDVIVSVAGHPVRDQSELARLLGKPEFKPGQKVKIVVRRDGRPFEATVTLGRYE